MVVFVICAVTSGCVTTANVLIPATYKPMLGYSHFVASDGAVLPVRVWKPQNGHPKAIMVALHGFNDYSRAFELPGSYFSQRDIAWYAYDQRGFGQSPGRGMWAGIQAYAQDTIEFIQLLRGHYPSVPIYLLGESMGAAIAIVAAVSSPSPQIEGLILIAPAVWALEAMPWYQQMLLHIIRSTWPSLELTGEGLEIQASDNIDMLRDLSRDPLVIKATRVSAIAGLTDLMGAAQRQSAHLKPPILVLYGEKDQVIPKEPVLAMVNRLPKSKKVQVRFYKNGYHLLLRDKQANQIWKEIADWVDKQNNTIGLAEHNAPSCIVPN